MELYIILKSFLSKLFGYNSPSSQAKIIVIEPSDRNLKRSLSSNDIPEFGKKFKSVRFKE